MALLGVPEWRAVTSVLDGRGYLRSSPSETGLVPARVSGSRPITILTTVELYLICPAPEVLSDSGGFERFDSAKLLMGSGFLQFDSRRLHQIRQICSGIRSFLYTVPAASSISPSFNHTSTVVGLDLPAEMAEFLGISAWPRLHVTGVVEACEQVPAAFISPSTHSRY